MARIFHCEFQVRGYELDGYGHVNNAVYLNYAEYARWCMIGEASGGADYFKENSVAPIVVRAEIEYKKPCFLAEWLKVETSAAEIRKRAVVFRQRVLKRDSGVLAAELLVTAMVVGPGGRAISLPPDFERLYG